MCPIPRPAPPGAVQTSFLMLLIAAHASARATVEA